MPGQPIEITCDPSNSTASPDPIPVHGKDVVLKFKLKKPNQWQWAATNAIVINNGGTQFTAPAQGNDGVIRVTDSNTDTNNYTYAFSAVPKGGGEMCTIDPSIQNYDD